MPDIDFAMVTRSDCARLAVQSRPDVGEPGVELRIDVPLAGAANVRLARDEALLLIGALTRGVERLPGPRRDPSDLWGSPAVPSLSVSRPREQTLAQVRDRHAQATGDRAAAHAHHIAYAIVSSCPQAATIEVACGRGGDGGWEGRLVAIRDDRGSDLVALEDLPGLARYVAGELAAILSVEVRDRGERWRGRRTLRLTEHRGW